MRQIGAKYHTQGEIYKYDGSQIPPDEPVILFRARDKLVPQVLDFYVQLRQTQADPAGSMEKLLGDVAAIKQWQAAHPEKLKQPGN